MPLLDEIKSFLSTPTAPAPTYGSDYESYVDELASQHPNVPTDVVKNLIQKESSWKSDATVYTGKAKYGMARGLGQFIDETASRYIPQWSSPADSYDPQKNIQGIFNYLDDLVKKEGSIDEALKTYHGRGTDILGTTSEGYARDILSGTKGKPTQREPVNLADIRSFLGVKEEVEEPKEVTEKPRLAGFKPVEETKFMPEIETAVAETTGVVPEFAKTEKGIIEGERDIIGNIAESFRRGEVQSTLDYMAWEAMEGKRDWKEVEKLRKGFQQKSSEDPVKARNWLTKSIMTVSGMLPNMIKGLMKGQAMGAGTALAAGGTAFALGQAGPQIATPEEVVTVPVAAGTGYALGTKIGATEYWRKVSAGRMYAELKEKGVKDKTSNVIANVASVPYSLIEMAQLSKLAPGSDKVLKNIVTKNIVRKAAQLVTRRGVDILEESAQEGIQGSIDQTAQEIGQYVEGQLGKKDLPQSAKNVLGAFWTDFKGSLGAMALMMTPKGVTGAIEILGEGKPTTEGIAPEGFEFERGRLVREGAGKEIKEAVKKEVITETPEEKALRIEIAEAKEAGEKAPPIAKGEEPIPVRFERPETAEELLKAIEAKEKAKKPVVKPKVEKPKIKGKLPTPIEIEKKLPSPKPKLLQPAEPAAGGLPYGAKLPEKVQGANIKKILKEGLDRVSAGEKEYDVKKFVVDVADQYRPEIHKARRGRVSHEETKALADAMGIKEKELIENIGQEDFAAKVKAYQNVFVQSAVRSKNEINNILKKKKWEISEGDRSKIALAFSRHAAVQAAYGGKAAEAGRALNILKTISEGVKNNELAQVTEALGGKEMTKKMMDRLIEYGRLDDQMVNTLARDLHKATTFDKFNEIWVNSILSAPTTQMANITGNTATALFKPLVESPVAASIEFIRKGPKGREVFFGQAGKELISLAQGIPEGIRAFGHTWITEQPSDVKSKLETLRFKSIKGKKGEVIRTPGRTLLAADEFFKTILKRMSISSEAYRQAQIEKRKKGLSKRETIEFYAQLKNNPTEKMMEKARKEARYRTFQEELGDDLLSKGAKVLQYGREKIPAAKFIVPFIRTPTNIARFSLERTPLSFYEKLNKITKGEITNEKISEELAKPIAGSMLVAGAVGLALQGLITGAGPKDKKKRNALYRTGWQPYSLKIGDKYFSFARLEPLGSILGMTADFVTLKEPDDKMQDIALKMAQSFGRNITSKTYMQGLSKAFDAVSDPERYGDRFVSQFAGSLIPNIIARGATASDKRLVEVDNLRDVYMSRFPGLRSMLYAKRDIWGREIKREGSFFTQFVSPMQYSAAKGDKIDQELVDIGAAIGTPSKKLSVTKDEIKKYKLKKDYVEMTPEEYDNYTKNSGRLARNRVERIMRTGEYRKASNEDKINLVMNGTENIKGINETRKQIRDRMRMKIVRRYYKKDIQLAWR